MWDEEDLEHLGGLTSTPGSNTTHHIGSFDSDLSTMVSVDILLAIGERPLNARESFGAT